MLVLVVLFLLSVGFVGVFAKEAVGSGGASLCSVVCFRRPIGISPQPAAMQSAGKDARNMLMAEASSRQGMLQVGLESEARSIRPTWMIADTIICWHS